MSTIITPPHFCNPACYAGHATARDLAVAAAELCQDVRHFELYPDTATELTEAHVNAHQTEAAGQQPCATCGLAVEATPGQPSWHSAFKHVDVDAVIRNWPGHPARPAQPNLIDQGSR